MYFQNLDGSTLPRRDLFRIPQNWDSQNHFLPRGAGKNDGKSHALAVLLSACPGPPKFGLYQLKIDLFPGPKKHDLAIALRTDKKQTQ